jgi:hypothetical protein
VGYTGRRAKACCNGTGGWVKGNGGTCLIATTKPIYLCLFSLAVYVTGGYLERSIISYAKKLIVRLVRARERVCRRHRRRVCVCVCVSFPPLLYGLTFAYEGCEKAKSRTERHRGSQTVCRKARFEYEMVVMQPGRCCAGKGIAARPARNCGCLKMRTRDAESVVRDDS